MNLSGNKIKVLESRVFSPCKKLRKLILNNNEIEEIDMDAFDELENLEEINLSDNKLKTIPHKSLSQLKGLKTLNLAKNSLVVKYGQFPTSLVTLDLSYNKLENFTLKSIISLADLKNLILNGNQIYRIRQHIFPDNILESLKSLKHIQLSDNEFYCTILGKLNFISYHNLILFLILADIVLWLEKNKIKIVVESHLIILNSSNILGVGCKEEARPLF
jgi:Leucine-rich repeat (LRR) protein